MLVLIWLVVIAAALWLFTKKKSRLESHGVKKLPPLEMFKNTVRLLTRSEHLIEDVDRNYKAFPNERFTSRFDFSAPVVMATDIELIKRITIKDFEHFLDHRTPINKKTDPLFGRNLISLNGQEWKDMRSTLSPAFTSSKIRHMVPFMVEVGKQMMESLKTKIQQSDNDYIDVDVKDLTTRYANDVIASCAFGLNVNSHTDVDNQFYKMGKTAVNFDGITTFLKFFFLLIAPRLMAKFKISLFSEEIKSFFVNMVIGTMKDREAKNIIRPDMIHLLMEAKKGQLVHDDKANDTDNGAGFATVEESVVGKKSITREWTDYDLVAQAILFFMAGFETVSTAMSFTLHELAVNPDIQDKLVKEIKETDAKTGGKFDYNTIQNMTYMDMVVSEVLRLWPPASLLDRLCIKDYNLGKANDEPTSKDFYVRAGEGILIPVFSIHRDPKFFPNPNKFDPERFSEENKHNIKPFTYLPFGSGPRNCIGSRFALCEVKVMLYQLLRHMEVSPNEKTCIPAKLNPKSLNVGLLGGHWVRFRMRKE